MQVDHPGLIQVSQLLTKAAVSMRLLTVQSSNRVIM
jgi:hypothetical protein